MNYLFIGLTPLSSIFSKRLRDEGHQVDAIDKDYGKTDLYKLDFNTIICGDCNDNLTIKSLVETHQYQKVLVFIKNDIASSLVACSNLLRFDFLEIHSVFNSIEHQQLLWRIGIKTDIINDNALFDIWYSNHNSLKPKVYLDMDGVLADLAEGARIHPANNDGKYVNRPDEIEGVFRNLPPVKGAIEAVNKLLESKKYDMYILTTAPWSNPSAWIDKRLWIEDHFGDSFKKRMIITHRKDLLMGAYLIDDRTANGAGEFVGRHLHFGWDYINKKHNEFKDWEAILKILI